MPAPRVLVVADYYLPGYRAGGPIRAIANSVARLAGDVAFSVITRDHDTDGVPYGDVEAGRWTCGPAPAICYAPRLSHAVLVRAIRESAPDVIWLNSFFSRASLRLLLRRRLGLVRQPILLAPRGEFSPGALVSKRRRKRIAMRALATLGVLKGVHWIASSDLEAAEIRAAVEARLVTVVPESVHEPAPAEACAIKQAGSLRLAFASRIDRKKNLRFLLEVLTRSSGRVRLDVIGPIDSRPYWESCRRVIARMPANVTVEYVGEVPHADIGRRLREYDLMVLPTLGENFGHIVVEAWAAGCPVLLSDRTPWRDLAAHGAGWDLPLDEATWLAALQRCIALTPDEHAVMRERARQRARRAWQDGISGDRALQQLMVALAAGAHPCV